jgi:hypothetical protein
MENIGGLVDMTKKEIIKIGREFSKDIGHAFIKGSKKKMEDAITLLDQTAAPFLKIATRNPDFLLELKRRVAEKKFLLSDEQKRPLKEVESYYKTIRKLGFTDFNKKATYTIIFARYCLRLDSREKGIQLLKKLKREINAHIKFYEDLKNNVDKILNENGD